VDIEGIIFCLGRN